MNHEKEHKSLEELTLLDRFLFAAVADVPENLKIMLEIILGREVIFEQATQTEKEVRTAPNRRSIRLDVWAEDADQNIYDVESQDRDTGNLLKRSRYYQSLIDGKLLRPGETDFNKLNPVYIILISPFDLFGEGKYVYTFSMQCEEVPGKKLGDDATRIFLNCNGTNPEEVSPELVELLQYFKNTNDVNFRPQSKRVEQLKEHVLELQHNADLGVWYMQAWEEKELDRKEAMEEGRNEGLREGRTSAIISLLKKGLLSLSAAAEELGISVAEVEKLL